MHHDANLRPAAFAPAHRDDPRETLRRRRSAEMKLYGRVGDISVDLELCGMEEVRRQSQSELPLETVSDTAGDDTGPSRQGSAIGPEHPHVCLLGPDLHHLRAVRDLDPGPSGGSAELSIELAPIDDHDAFFVGAERESVLARRRHDTRLRTTQDEAFRKPELTG